MNLARSGQAGSEFANELRVGQELPGLAKRSERWMTISIADPLLELVPEAIARENCVLPFEIANEFLALYYPADLASPALLEDQLRFVLERPVRLVPLERRKLREEIEVHYSRPSPYEVLTPSKTASLCSATNAPGNGIP